MTHDEFKALARRNLEILMLHDPENVDDVAVLMQMLSITRAVTKSRKISRDASLARVLPGADRRHLGRTGLDRLPFYSRAGEIVTTGTAWLPVQDRAGRRPLGDVRTRRRFRYAFAGNAVALSPQLRLKPAQIRLLSHLRVINQFSVNEQQTMV